MMVFVVVMALWVMRVIWVMNSSLKSRWCGWHSLVVPLVVLAQVLPG